MTAQPYETLCVNCVRAGSCTIPGDWDEPVLSCNMFKPLGNVGTHNFTDILAPDPGRVEGICLDCCNRRSCMFRQTEGGTWHCEEYC